MQNRVCVHILSLIGTTWLRLDYYSNIRYIRCIVQIRKSTFQNLHLWFVHDTDGAAALIIILYSESIVHLSWLVIMHLHLLIIVIYSRALYKFMGPALGFSSRLMMVCVPHELNMIHRNAARIRFLFSAKKKALHYASCCTFKMEYRNV